MVGHGHACTQKVGNVIFDKYHIEAGFTETFSHHDDNQSGGHVIIIDTVRIRKMRAYKPFGFFSFDTQFDQIFRNRIISTLVFSWQSRPTARVDSLARHGAGSNDCPIEMQFALNQ